MEFPVRDGNVALEIIDVHSHCFAARTQTEEIGHGLRPLRDAGLRHRVVVGLVNTHLDAEAIWNLIPRYVDNQGDPLFFEVDHLLALAADHAPVLLTFVDTRHMFGDVPSLLGEYMAKGFRGLKGIYLADDGNDLGVGNVPDTFGISLEAYQRREWEIFAFAAAHELPLVYHMDARRYGDVMEALLEDFPQVRVDFAHFGIGRGAFRRVLDRHPNVFTDLASMLPHVRRDPKGYRDFILHYPDRVCFGSDANLYAPETVFEYIRMVRELELPPEVESQVFSANPRRFLGSALP